MPLGMVPQVVQPASAGSPSWAVHLVNAGTAVWDLHPVAAAAAAVWVQVGIGLWLLAAPRGDWSRVGGVASVGWGLLVWVFGEAFGQSTRPRSVLAVRCAWRRAVLLLRRRPDRLTRRGLGRACLGRVVLRAMGAFFVAMAILQAWPGRGFWQGQVRPGASPGSLAGMVNRWPRHPSHRSCHRG